MSPAVSWVHRQGRIRRKNGHHIIYIHQKNGCQTPSDFCGGEIEHYVLKKDTSDLRT
jgi:hypothetical protein